MIPCISFFTYRQRTSRWPMIPVSVSWSRVIHPYGSSVNHWRRQWTTPTYRPSRQNSHYINVIMTAMNLKSPASRLFTQPLIQAQIKENIKASCHWPLWGEFTGKFPAQRASNAEKVSIWWRYHAFLTLKLHWLFNSFHLTAMYWPVILNQ